MSPPIAAAACVALARLSRTASTTRAPARASSRAATRPMPLLAPVTTNVRPSRSGRSAAVQFECHAKVVGDNNDVNVYIVGRLPAVPTRAPLSPREPALGAARRGGADARERGVAALSLRELARQVGVSHAAPRRHFADRQALLDALAPRTGSTASARSCAAAVDAAGAGFDAQLRAFARAYVRFATERRRAARADVRRQAPRGARRLRRRGRARVRHRARAHRRRPGRGRAAPGDPKGAGLVLFAMFQGLASLRSSGMLDDAELRPTVRGAVAALLDGLRP